MNFRIILAVMAFSALSVSCDSDDDLNVDRDDNTVDVQEPQLRNRSELFVTSNTNNTVMVMQNMDDRDDDMITLGSMSGNNVAVRFDGARDEMILVDGQNGTLSTTGDMQNILGLGSGDLSNSVTGSPAFNTPQAMAISDDLLVIADNANNELYTYRRTDNGPVPQNVFSVDENITGLEFVGDDLYATVDGTGGMVVFFDFFTNTTNGNLASSRPIMLDGVVAARGIAFDRDSGTLAVTDVGDITDSRDGGVVMINDFLQMMDNSTNMITIPENMQTRIYGQNTQLGNPRAIQMDPTSNRIFVAEETNGGGRLLSYTMNTVSGDFAPTMSMSAPGASSLSYYREEAPEQ